MVVQADQAAVLLLLLISIMVAQEYPAKVTLEEIVILLRRIRGLVGGDHPQLVVRGQVLFLEAAVLAQVLQLRGPL